MQTQEAFNVGRRAMDMEDYVDILRRHKSWILGPLYAGVVIATVVACLWPDTYVSSAVVRVTPPQVPERFVQSALNQMLNERINSISQQVLSRSTLINIIQTFDLYERDRRRLPMEDVVDRMRNKDIVIGMVSSLQGQSARAGAFPVTFKYEDRYKAQKVTQEIVSRLISENTRVQLGVTQNTTEFLTEEVQKAKTRLDQIEQSLTNFRMKNAGRLPDERTMNFTALQSTETRIASINGAIQRINQEKLMLEAQMRLQREQFNQAVAASAAAATAGGASEVVKTRVANERLVALEREILNSEQILARLREQYKENFPDVQRVKTNLEALQKQREQLLKREEDSQRAEAAKPAPAKPVNSSVPLTREMQAMQLSLKQMETLIQAKQNEAQDYSAELVRLNSQVREFQNRIGSTPIADQEFSALSRDYESAKLEYQQLLAKQSDAKRGQEVERRNQGETLELLDAASLPIEPTEPKRPVIIGSGAALGLLLGLLLVGVREMKDTTLKNLKDVQAYTQLTILGSIPLLEEDIVVKRRKRLTMLAWATAILVGLLVMAGSFYYYIATKP
jgi:succinoglycan biosynthesis transport protein ExoP